MPTVVPSEVLAPGHRLREQLLCGRFGAGRHTAVLELGSLRLSLSHGADLSRVEAAVRELESLPDATPWRRVVEVHGRVHHEIVCAAGNERLLDAYRACEVELRQLFGVLRPGVPVRELARSHRRLVDQLHAAAAVPRQLVGT